MLNRASNRTEGGRRDPTTRAPNRRVGRVIKAGVGLPAHHNKVTGPIAKQNVVLNIRVHHRTRHTIPGRARENSSVTWASGSLPFRPHGTRFTLPRTGTCALARLVPQRTRRSRTTFCLMTSPAISSRLAGNLIPIITSRRMCRLGAPIAVLRRFRELPETLPLRAHFLDS